MSTQAFLSVLAAVTLHEAPHHTTEATITVDAPPAEVYALITDYAGWSTFSTDATEIKVERADRRNGRVRFHSRAIDHTVTVQFDNEQDHIIKFVGIEGPPGGRASGSYILEPVDGGQRTKITASLYLDVVGVTGIFVSDSKIRGMRQAKLRSDLNDLLQRFASRRAA